MGWGKSLLKGGGKLLGGVGAHTKGVMLLGGGGYAAYQYSRTGQGALSTWGDLLMGKETMDKARNDGVGTVVGDFLLGDGKTEKAVEKGKDLVSGVGDAVGGIAQGGSGLFGTMGNMISGLFSGGTSSLVGLIAAGMMLFGNFGWMGKIVCGLIAAMSFGLFSVNSSQQQVNQQISPALAQPVRGQQMDYGQQSDDNDESNGNVVYRPRR
jgi:hypothetical protein